MNLKNHLFIVVLLTFSPPIFADVFDDLDKEIALIEKYCVGGDGRLMEEIISSKVEQLVYCFNGSKHIVENVENNNKKLSKDNETLKNTLSTNAVGKEYTCTFESSFLIGMCDGNQYFYVAELSSVKRQSLTKFYRFVDKNNTGEPITDICVDIAPSAKSKKQGGNFIKCNDLGITLLLDDT